MNSEVFHFTVIVITIIKFVYEPRYKYAWRIFV